MVDCVAIFNFIMKKCEIKIHNLGHMRDVIEEQNRKIRKFEAKPASAADCDVPYTQTMRGIIYRLGMVSAQDVMVESCVFYFFFRFGRLKLNP